MSTGTVVIIEDDPILSKVVREELVEQGFTVRQVFDGSDAFNIIKEVKPNVILLDLLLPKKDGYRILEEIKADPETKSVPVIILTMLSGEENISRGLDLGATDYIVKSHHSVEEVAEKVKNIMVSNIFRT